MKHYFELLLSMTEKELRSRYKFTILGFIWLVANPLLQMIVIGFVFTYFMKEPIRYYYYHLFSGLLVWNFFSLSLTKATPSIVYERSLIKKAFFPRSVIPLSIVASNAINFSLAFCILLIPIFFLNTLSGSSIIYILISLLYLLAFTVGCSLISSALNVRFRDINFFVQAILLIWFYATPIIYSLHQMPHNIAWIWRLNPLTCILQILQNALIGSPLPDLYTLIISSCTIFFFFFIGIYIFHVESQMFDDWV